MCAFGFGECAANEVLFSCLSRRIEVGYQKDAEKHPLKLLKRAETHLTNG